MSDGNINDGMIDLGNTPAQVLAIRNKRTGEVALQRNYPDPHPVHGWAWEHVVRRAYHHSDEAEMLDFVPGEDGDPSLGLDSIAKAKTTKQSALGLITMPDGQPVTKANIAAMHYKTLVKFAKDHGVEVKDKTPAAIREDLLLKISELNNETKQLAAQV